MLVGLHLASTTRYTTTHTRHGFSTRSDFPGVVYDPLVVPFTDYLINAITEYVTLFFILGDAYISYETLPPLFCFVPLCTDLTVL